MKLFSQKSVEHILKLKIFTKNLLKISLWEMQQRMEITYRNVEEVIVLKKCLGS